MMDEILIDEPKDWTQVLKIEINGKHPRFECDHTPGICYLIHQIATELERYGVQMTKLPWAQEEEGEWLFRVDPVETIGMEDKQP